MERRKTKKFFSGFRTEDQEGQSAKNLAGEGNYFAARNEFMALSRCFECELCTRTRTFDGFSKLKKENGNVQYCIEFEWNF